MIKGLAITPPVLGRITIGRVIERDGKRLPQMSDEFTITSQVQSAEGWVRHPLDEKLREQQGETKLRRIPVRLLFSEPELNLRAEYALFDRDTGRPLCVGNGETCRRRTAEGITELPCPSPDGCELAAGGRCKPYGRLNVVVGEDEEDPLGSFVFRTTGFNSIRTLAARLDYFKAVSGNRLACLPLELRIRGKSTRQSFGRPIVYVDLTLRSGMTLGQALSEAQSLEQEREAMGFHQRALDTAARQGLANGAFEDSAEEGAAVVDEFYPQEDVATVSGTVRTLSEKLGEMTSSTASGDSSDASAAATTTSSARDDKSTLSSAAG